MSARTEYGFTTGAIEVINAIEHERGSSVIVKIGRARIEIDATRAGRKAHIRVRHGIGTEITVDQILWSSESPA